MLSKIVIVADCEAEALVANHTVVVDLLPIFISAKMLPFRTGVALHALDDTEGQIVLVINWDSFVCIDVVALLADHEVAETIFDVPASKCGSFGALELADKRRVGLAGKDS